jgi:NADP-dependent 3-hydroxy acid dehydrogenase YdfG
MKKTAIIISANSDIAYHLCLRLLNDGWKIYGTYRKHDNNTESLIEKSVSMHKMDLSDKNSVHDSIENLKVRCKGWDLLLNATGTQSPVGMFIDNDFEEWSESIHINFIEQVRIIHSLLCIRNDNSTVLFFAGGGTNNAVLSYSAYTISKIASIKVCELLDAEIKNTKFAIIGPGWVRTRIHNETINVGEVLAGDSYQTTLKHFENDDFTPMNDVIDSIEWIISQPKRVVGGRNFSTVYDAWGDDDLVKLLEDDNSMYKLRRSGNDSLQKSQFERLSRKL